MKQCPECGRTYTDQTLRFCLYDGKPLSESAAPPPQAPPPVQPQAYPQQLYPPQPPYPQPYPPPRKSSGGGIIFGVLGLFILLGIGMRLLPHGKPSPAPPSPIGKEQTEPAASPDDTALRDSLMAAVGAADEAEAKAFQQLDPAPLSPIYTGAALQREIANLEALKKSGLSLESHLEAQEFGDMRVSKDRTVAQVDVRETWRQTTYSQSTGKPLGDAASHVVPQTVLLRRSGDTWVVEDIQPKSDESTKQ